MKVIIKSILKLITILLVATTTLASDNLRQQWKQGLTGAKLTAYDGSVVSNNSSLTVIDFCKNGRYSFYKDAGWTIEGAASAISKNLITGSWSIKTQSGAVILTYKTDKGRAGVFPIYLQTNGRVNIGGVSYAAQKGGANCNF